MQVSAAAPGLGYIPYTAPVTGNYSWLDLATVAREDIANAFTVGGQSITSEGTAIVPLVVKGASGQSASLQEWQNSGGTVLSRVQSDGSITGTSLTVTSGGTYTTGSIYSDTNWGMIFRGRTASPTNAHYRWANSADTELMRLDNSGRLFVTNQISGVTQGSAQIEARTVNATTIGMIVRGAASQSANLQEWQNSGGTALASVANNGVIKGAEVRTNNTQLVMREAGGGGNLYMVRASSAPAAPGSNVGTLYFRDGTNAGTLKLVVRAGAAGAETTILDNIPQT
jgi:hypothetical protein